MRRVAKFDVKSTLFAGDDALASEGCLILPVDFQVTGQANYDFTVNA